MATPPHEITQALLDARNGDAEAADRLWRLVYEQIKSIAHRELRGERTGHTLATTDLVHEAYLKLVDQTRIEWRERAHFYALACIAMRQVLVEHARRRDAEKRRPQKEKAPLEEALTMAVSRSEELVALEEALERLAARDGRLVQVVECRFFGGLSVEETARVLGLSERTVVRDWKRARAHLYEALR